MKILILQDDFPPFEQGGAGVIAGLVAKSLVSLGQEVFVITTVQEKERVGKFVENGITIFRIYSKYHERWRSYVSLYNWRVLPQIKRIIKEINPDVVNAHNIHYHISYHALKIACRYTDKVFLTAHDIMAFYQGSFTEFIDKNNLNIPEKFNYRVNSLMLIKAFKKRYNPLHNLLVKYYLGFTKNIIAVSDALKDALSQNGIKNIVVIKNGIDTGNWIVSEAESSTYKKSINATEKEVVLFGGRLSGAKGGWLILKVMAEVVKKRPRASLIIFGRGEEYLKKVEKTARELGISDNIIYGGWNGEDVLKLQYSISDVVVVPSICFDSFPTVNLQAFASSKPVVATCFGGSREIVKDGENGFIVNPFDVKNMSDMIVKLLSDKELAEKFGRNGRELLNRDYTTQVMGQNYLDLFSK